MKTCGFCGRPESDQPMWHDASGSRCQDGPGCEAYRKSKSGLRARAVKPHERRSDRPPTPDEAKAAWADSRSEATGGTATATAPTVKTPPAAEKPERRRTVDEILYGVRGDAPEIETPQAQLCATGDERSRARPLLDDLLFGGNSRRSADGDLTSNASSGEAGEAVDAAYEEMRAAVAAGVGVSVAVEAYALAMQQESEKGVMPRRSVDAILFGAVDQKDLASNADSSDSNRLTSLQLRAWTALEAAVASGDDGAMVNALLVWSQVSGIELTKSAKPTLDEILYGGARKTVTITVSDDEDAAGEDETEAGEAANLALTPDQAMYWEALQQAVSAGGVGIDVESLTTAARNFYNSCSIGL